MARRARYSREVRECARCVSVRGGVCRAGEAGADDVDGEATFECVAAEWDAAAGGEQRADWLPSLVASQARRTYVSGHGKLPRCGQLSARWRS
jgi:hypothetical protein